MNDPLKTIQSETFRGTKLRYRQMDWSAVDEIFLRGEYDAVYETLDPNLRHVALDLGANIGCFTAALLRRIPDAFVVSVEPSRETFEVLEQNRALHPAAQWTSVHGAVADQNGSAVLSTCAASTVFRLSNYVNDQSRFTTEEVVPTQTMDSLLDLTPFGRATLVKMDVEGAEKECLRKGAPWIHRVDRLVVELHNDRIDISEPFATLRSSYPFIYDITGRESRKPLLYCGHQAMQHPRLVLHQW
jgi:FkbM family methyltransferase